MGNATPAVFVLAAAALLTACGAGDDGLENSALNSTVARGGRCPITSSEPGCARDGGTGGGDDGGGAQDGGGGGGSQDSGGAQDGGRGACVEREDELCAGGCNGADGSDTAACLAEGNSGGCTDAMFQGWCRRRTAQADLWPASTRDWVDARCAGPVTLERGPDGYDQYVCHDDAACVTYRCSTPLVLVFDARAAVAYGADDGRAAFDLAAHGEPAAVRTDWPSAATPWLALDRDGDGAIASGRELFGSATEIAGLPARHGFEALAALDADGDGDVDADDPAFAELVVWSDADGDRRSSRVELRTLASYGVASLPVAFRAAPRCDARGNCEVERAAFRWRDASGRDHDGALVDVHLAVR